MAIINKHRIKTRVSFKNARNVTVKYLQRVKYLCDYGTDNYNRICPGIKGVKLDVQTIAFLLLQQAE
jgi:hypothetical protein